MAWSQSPPLIPVNPAHTFGLARINAPKKRTAEPVSPPMQAAWNFVIGFMASAFRRDVKRILLGTSDWSEPDAIVHANVEPPESNRRHGAPQIPADALDDAVRCQVASRDEFDRLRRVDPATLADIERATRFLSLQRLAFGGKVAARIAVPRRAHVHGDGPDGPFDRAAWRPLLLTPPVMTSLSLSINEGAGRFSRIVV